MMDDRLNGTSKGLKSARTKSYSVFGLLFESDFPFANRLPEQAGSPDFHFTCVTGEPPAQGWRDAGHLIFESPLRGDGGESLLLLYRAGDLEVLHFPDVADFYLWPRRVVCHLLDAAYEHVVEIWFLGIVLSYWLERQGVPALHASAVVTDHGAVAFLGHNKGGKSGAAATLMQLGCPLLTDDILAVRKEAEAYLGSAGYPQMRMWPDQAGHFLGHYEDLEKVHPAYSKRRVSVGPDGLGAFYHAPQPLRRFYLLERRDAAGGLREPEVTPLSPGEAAIELVRHSFLPRIVEATRLQPQRLSLFAGMAERIPMRKIVYPSGWDRLSQLGGVILEEAGAVPKTKQRLALG